MKKLIVVLLVIVLLAGLVLAVTAGSSGGGGGSGFNVARMYCTHESASNSGGRSFERIAPGLGAVRGGSTGCPAPLPIG